MTSGMNLPLIEIGTILTGHRKGWKVASVGLVGGERYYWLTKQGCVSMVPATTLWQEFDARVTPTENYKI